MCRYGLRMFLNKEPFVDQYTKRGINLSWNPDDGRFYIMEVSTKETLGSFKEWRNTVQFFKKESSGGLR